MFDFDELIGMTYEQVTEFVDEQGWDTDWCMDYFYVNDYENHWVCILFTSDWIVRGWEAV